MPRTKRARAGTRVALPAWMVRALLFLFVVLAAGRAPAAEPITHLVAGRVALHALRGNNVVTFDAAGHERWRCAGFDAPPERAARTSTAIVDADAALDLAGLPDDELDTPEAEDALADEGIVIARKVARAVATATVVRALAASGDDVWIATSAGLYQGREGVCRRVGLAGRDVVAVSAAGADTILAATADLVWRGTAGASPRVVAGLTHRPRAIAVVDGDRGYVADDEGVLDIGPYGIRGRILDQATTAIVVCGGVVIALARDGTYRWIPGEPPARTGDRLPVRALACGANTSARFVAFGDGVYTSHDGVNWIERVEGRGRIVAGAAAAGGHLWLALDGRLVTMEADSRRALPSQHRAAVGFAPLETGRLLAPAAPWPQVSLVFAAQQTPLRFGWSVVALFAFPLERAALSGGDRRRLAAEWVERDAALAGEASRLEDSEEDAALLDVVRQEREALR